MSHNRKVSIVGLGYVGLPIAVAFGRKEHVIAFDVNKTRIEELKAGYDRNRDVCKCDFEGGKAEYTTDPARLRDADFHIVAVPTPIDIAKRPDLGPLARASETVGGNLRPGSIIVYESTVYPGATEEICVPLLEKVSGLKCGRDFKVGYSPERINPGDHEHTFTKILKIVSGQDAETLEIVASVYASVVTAGVHKAASIKVAEAAKVIENTQRDLNIALINELAIIFHRMGIDTNDVLEAAGTKWNFLKFAPGLVGGHCIGVDPYYLTHKAEQLGYIPQVILSGRRINDGMGVFVAKEVVKRTLARGELGFDGKRPTVTILGFTFKENVSDLRNSRVIDIVHALKSYSFDVQVHDPLAYPEEAEHEYGIKLVPFEELKPANAVILAVSHNQFKTDPWKLVTGLLRGGEGIVADVRNVLPRKQVPEGVTLWRL
ncbi:MAG TPA: nucleotide sugar dehydrogenase [Acidobacteriota bacterium]|nr:nucleotide sugar dehydrogenase [Acidobacteriota bacterium]